MEITLAVILSYISNYFLAFVISLLGAFTSEVMTAMRTKKKISLLRILTPGIFDGFLLCALQSNWQLSFAAYAFLCFMMGLWGIHIVEVVSNYKFVSIFLKTLLTASSSSIAKAAGESLNKIDEEKEEKKQRKSTSSTKNKPKE